MITTKVTRRSMLTGKVHTLKLPVTEAELDAYYAGAVDIQVAFPNLSVEQREFIKSGITPDEWPASRDDENDN